MLDSSQTSLANDSIKVIALHIFFFFFLKLASLYLFINALWFIVTPKGGERVDYKTFSIQLLEGNPSSAQMMAIYKTDPQD